LLQRQERAVAEPRGVGDGADRWGPGVSCWARQLPGAARLGRHDARGWAGVAGLLARSWAERERVGWGAGCGAGPREKKMAMGRMRGRGGMEGNSLFLFINKIFKLIFKRFLESFSI